jgi:hypothetical protein
MRYCSTLGRPAKSSLSYVSSLSYCENICAKIYRWATYLGMKGNMLRFLFLGLIIWLAIFGLRWLLLGDPGPNDEDTRDGWHGWF